MSKKRQDVQFIQFSRVDGDTISWERDDSTSREDLIVTPVEHVSLSSLQYLLLTGNPNIRIPHHPQFQV